jgi:hypothetical protein
MADLKAGDSVTWNTPQGKTEGKVTKKLTNDTSIQGHKVSASRQDPQYEVKSDSTGKKAAHKPSSLDKK